MEGADSIVKTAQLDPTKSVGQAPYDDLHPPNPTGLTVSFFPTFPAASKRSACRMTRSFPSRCAATEAARRAAGNQSESE